jgi:hypothetical protein
MWRLFAMTLLDCVRSIFYSIGFSVQLPAYAVHVPVLHYLIFFLCAPKPF